MNEENKVTLEWERVNDMLHRTIMILAEDWARNTNKSRDDWYRGRVSGAMLMWHGAALVFFRPLEELHRGWDEYSALITT